MSKVLTGWMFGAAALLASAPALAQAPTTEAPVQTASTAPAQSQFTRDRNISVTQRARPGYDPVPIQSGGFSILPELDAGIEQNDNIYVTNANKKSDTIVTVDPRIDVDSNWSRNALQAFARGATRAYTRYTTESTTDYEVGAQGRIDAGTGNVSGGGDTGEYTEPRTAVTATPSSKAPIRYQLSDGFVSGVEEFNRVRLTGRIDLQNFDYHNGQNTNGTTLVEDDRNHTTYTYYGKGEYAVSPDTSVYLDASFNDHQYQLSPPAAPTNRNAHGEQVNLGASFDLTKTIRGYVKVGYMTENFAATQFSTYSGFSAMGSVEWFPDELTTVTLTGSHQIQDAAADGSAIYVSGVGSLQIDHELLRNLLLNARVGYENDAYRGLARTDTQTTAYVGAKYLMNRVVGFTLGYTYLNQTSAGAAKGPIYVDNRITLGTTLRF